MTYDEAFTVGFLDYPNHHNRPLAGTENEIPYCRGWSKAQDSEQISDKEWEFGRDSYFAHYDDPI